MKLTKLLNIKYPIIQGAMANIAKSSLASAVSEAGGLGIIASGGMNKEILRTEILKLKEKTDKPYGVNLMLMAPNLDDLIEVILELKPDVVTTGAGSPKKYIELFHEKGIKVIPVIASLKHALKMEALGVDAVICEGCEAGGHIGETSTLPLVQTVLKNVSIPVIAAGGISDGKAMASMMLLGASGVQMGTRFLLTNECDISFKYKEQIKNATQTVVTGRTNKTPIRGLENKMTEEFLKLEKENNREQLEKLTLGALKKAVNGDIENGSLMSGEIVALVTEEKPVKEVIEEIVKEARITLDNAKNIEIG